MKISNTLKLGLAIVSLPTFFTIYTLNTSSRIRCHVPSWEVGHRIFELTPYVFVLACIAFTIKFSLAALTATGHIFENLLALFFVFCLNVSAFALVYYNYGLQEPSDYIVSLPATEDRIDGVAVETGDFIEYWEFDARVYSFEEEGSNDQIEPGNSTPYAPIQVFKQREGMLADPVDYLLFSAAIAIPGGYARDIKICPSLRWFLPLQNFLGLIVSLMFAVFATRVSRLLDENHENG